MTEALLDRIDRESPERLQDRADRLAQQEGFKIYFHGVSQVASVEDLELTPNLFPEVDFVLRVDPDRVSDVSNHLLDLAYDIRERLGVRLTTVVLPKVQCAEHQVGEDSSKLVVC